MAKSSGRPAAAVAAAGDQAGPVACALLKDLILPTVCLPKGKWVARLGRPLNHHLCTDLDDPIGRNAKVFRRISGGVRHKNEKPVLP